MTETKETKMDISSDAPEDIKTTVKGLDFEGGSDMIKLISSNKKEFTLSRRAAYVSKLVKDGLELDKSATEFPLPQVTSKVLARIHEYLVKHDGQTADYVPEKPLRSKEMKNVCYEYPWDGEFIDTFTNQKDLYDIILAANYMNMNSLMDIGCAKVATMIKGQPLEKIKEILGKDYEPKAEEKKVESKSESKTEKKR